VPLPGRALPDHADVPGLAPPGPLRTMTVQPEVAGGIGPAVLAAPASRGTRSSLRRALGQLPVHLVLAGLGFFFALPLFWLLSSSLKDSAEIFRVPPTVLPSRIAWENYPGAFDAIPFLRYLSNTLLYVVGATVGAIL